LAKNTATACGKPPRNRAKVRDQGMLPPHITRNAMPRVIPARLTNCYWHGNSKGRYLDWSSDGCSPFPTLEDLVRIFVGIFFETARMWKGCERHDFGYRNYKEQSRFSRSTKHKIDVRLRPAAAHASQS
jgi:hypothetical protein